MLEVGDKVFVRDMYIKADWMVPQGEIVEIAYEKNTDMGIVYLIVFPSYQSAWIHKYGLKTK